MNPIAARHSGIDAPAAECDRELARSSGCGVVPEACRILGPVSIRSELACGNVQSGQAVARSAQSHIAPLVSGPDSLASSRALCVACVTSGAMPNSFIRLALIWAPQILEGPAAARAFDLLVNFGVDRE